MKMINQVNSKTQRVERVIQFGEGNFLRCFADWMIHRMNNELGFNSDVVVVQPIEQGLIELLEKQDCMYTVRLNGIQRGDTVSSTEVVDVVSRCVNPYNQYDDYLGLAYNKDFRFIISNTTEAGIAFDANDRLEDKPQSTFPGKLTALLYERYMAFDGSDESGFIIIPCELIESNGERLKSIVIEYAKLWNLEQGFVEWIDRSNIFCNTLVDRIVPGYPRDKIDEINKGNGYIDNLVVEGEVFHLWVIETDEDISKEFNPHDAGLNVIFTKNQKPYRERKVHILNGAHTSMVPVGLLMGIESVRESVDHERLGKYIEELIYKEVIPTLELGEDELKEFARDVLDRFRNPFIHHKLESISLNSLSKYKTRILPTVLRYIDSHNELPQRLVFALAALITLYKGSYMGRAFEPNDNATWVLEIRSLWKKYDDNEISYGDMAKAVLSYNDIWGMDLSTVDGFTDSLSSYLSDIEQDIITALKGVIS